MASGDVNRWIAMPYDNDEQFDTAANWSLGTAPVAGEHVVFPGSRHGEIGPGTHAHCQSGDFSGIGLLGSLTVEKDHRAHIGRWGPDFWLVVDVDITTGGRVVYAAGPLGGSLNYACYAAPVNVVNMFGARDHLDGPPIQTRGGAFFVAGVKPGAPGDTGFINNCYTVDGFTEIGASHIAGTVYHHGDFKTIIHHRATANPEFEILVTGAGNVRCFRDMPGAGQRVTIIGRGGSVEMRGILDSTTPAEITLCRESQFIYWPLSSPTSGRGPNLFDAGSMVTRFSDYPIEFSTKILTANGSIDQGGTTYAQVSPLSFGVDLGDEYP